MNDELIAFLEELAARKTWLDDEDFCAYDYSGGNYDDAFEGGLRAGEVILAQELLAKFKK